MEVVDIVHVPKKAKLVEVVELKQKDETKKAAEIEKEIHEFRKRAPKPRKCDCNWLSYMDRVPKWMWLTGLGLLIYAAMAFFISTMIVYFYSVQSTIRPIFSSNTAPGGSCSSTSQCVTNAYCVKSSGSNTGSCQCATNYYYDSTVSTSQCNARLAYGSACTTTTQCITSAGLTCISGTCGCNSNTYLYNTTSQRCQYLKYVNQYCTTGSDCYNTNTCSGNNRCICRSTNYYFNTLTGACVPRTVQNTACSSNTQCIYYAYCGLNSGDTFSKCYCDPLLYYYDSGSAVCRVRQSTYQSSCTYIDQCDLYTNNMRCFNGLCDCDPTLEKWNSNYTQCLNLYRYSKTCLNNAPYYGCITGSTYLLTCAAPDNGGIRNICRCTSTQYYDVLNPGCLTQKTYNTTCGTRSECSQYSFCSTYGSSSVTKRCICLPNYSYNFGTTCLQKKGYGQPCGNTYECQDYAGMVCSGGTCGCDSTIQFYNTTSGACQWLARTDDFCVASIQCSSGSCNWVSSLYTQPYCN